MSALHDGASAPTNLEQQRKLAKDLVQAARRGDPAALARMAAHTPKRTKQKLADAQLTVAREGGFESWPKMVQELEKLELTEAARALHAGDALALRKILAISPSARRRVNEPVGPFGGRPINMAAAHRDVLDVLLDFGADVNLRSDWPNGPFGVLDYCDEPTARHLLTRGAILTPHAAARLGWLDELRKLVDANPKSIHEKGGDGQRPLHFAKTVEVAALLLERGAEIDARCVDHHSTAAQYALADRPDVCRFLLSRGAVPDIFMPARLGDVALANSIIDSDERALSARVNLPGYPPVPLSNIYCWTLGFYVSPVEVALKYEQHEIASLLIDRSPPVARLLDAAWRGDATAARAVLANSPDLIARLTTEQHALLAHATHHQRDEAMKLMLSIGFNPSAGGTDGGTALHQAGWVGRADYVEWLLPYSTGSLNQPDPTHSSTPLGWATYGSVHRRNERGDYPRTIELLVKAGADLTRPGLMQSADGNGTVQEVLRSLGVT